MDRRRPGDPGRRNIEAEFEEFLRQPPHGARRPHPAAGRPYPRPHPRDASRTQRREAPRPQHREAPRREPREVPRSERAQASRRRSSPHQAPASGWRSPPRRAPTPRRPRSPQPTPAPRRRSSPQPAPSPRRRSPPQPAPAPRRRSPPQTAPSPRRPTPTRPAPASRLQSPPQPRQTSARIRTVFVDEKYVGKTEKLYRYKPEGAYPVHINDTLGPQRQYRVLNKLGSGSFGIVWLVEDRLDRRCRWKALKINDSTGGVDKEVKLQPIFEAKGVTGRKALEWQVCVPYEMFWVTGPNGKHLCSVLPILGAPLDKALKHDSELSARWICHQVILAMEFLHGTMGIFHGDFRPENILVQIEGLQELDEFEIMQVYGGDPKVIATAVLLKGKKVNLQRFPRYLVVNSTLDTKLLVKIIKQKTGKRMTPRKPKVAVTDFGSAFHKSWPGPWNQLIPRIMQDPWCACGGPASLASDIWALGHTIFTLMTGEDPFIRIGYDYFLSQFGDYFPGIEEAKGAMPVQMREMAIQSCLVSQAVGNGLPMNFRMEMDKHRPCTRSARDHFASFSKYCGKYKDAKCIPHALLLQTRGISRKEADLLWGLIGACCAWLPEQRPEIREITNHPWFYDWAVNEDKPEGKKSDKCRVQ